MDDDKSWWFCLKHCKWSRDLAAPARTGSVRTRPAKRRERWLETVQRRNEEWEAQDRWPGEGPDQG